MKFQFWTSPGYSHLKAVFENDDHRVGDRQEGVGEVIELVEDIATFDYEVHNIHPDLLGLLCMIIFYPFIGSEVEFPAPVSFALKEAFQLPCFTKQKVLVFRNISEKVQPYQEEGIALSFGGGIDSSAVKVMFPEAVVIHEAHTRNGTLIPSYAHNITKDIYQGHLVTTNVRYMSRPGGWHTWPCSTSTSLLLATDLKIGVIFTGAILGATCLKDGKGYYDLLQSRIYHGEAGNFWRSAFYKIGIPMISPVAGVSEFQTMKISLPLLDDKRVVYCMRDNGNACGVCTKCFRRDVIRCFICADHTVKWDAYDTPIIHTLLENRPMYCCHIFATAFSLKPEAYPKWIMEKVTDIPKVEYDWLMRAHTESFELYPSNLREFISTRVLRHVDAMDIADYKALRNWSCDK